MEMCAPVLSETLEKVAETLEKAGKKKKKWWQF